MKWVQRANIEKLNMLLLSSPQSVRWDNYKHQTLKQEIFIDLSSSSAAGSLSVSSSLQLEVSQLEGSLQHPKAQSSMSPYLVPDTAALCQHLNLIRQLAGSGCFIIIIPRTGLIIIVIIIISNLTVNEREMYLLLLALSRTIYTHGLTASHCYPSSCPEVWFEQEVKHNVNSLLPETESV